MLLHPGDQVVLIYRDRSVEATVLLASPNGRSLLLQFDALLGKCAGAMPVMGDERLEVFHSLIDDEPVTLAEMDIHGFRP